MTVVRAPPLVLCAERRVYLIPIWGDGNARPAHPSVRTSRG
jgi:hypothetical protein